jgi:hypothetical protein
MTDAAIRLEAKDLLVKTYRFQIMRWTPEAWELMLDRAIETITEANELAHLTHRKTRSKT